MNKMNVIFGIVCYKEKFWQCSSFLTLLKSFQLYNSGKISIFIFDNTDSEDWFTEYPQFSENIKIIYSRDKKNPGISHAYNIIAEYAKEQDFENIVFLDQDSLLPDNVYSSYMTFAKMELKVAAPKVISQGKLISPSKYKYYRSFSYGDIETDKIILKGNSCINSGLFINTELFFKAGGYNKDLRLDFCDHDFIERLSSFTEYLYILPYELNQNFSTNTNTLEQAIFRYRLFTKDLIAFKKNKNKILITFSVDIPHLLRLMLQYKTLAFFKVRF